MKRCRQCHQLKSNADFYEREDRPALYAFCKSCMDKEGRSVDFPPVEEQGGGVLYVNYSSLRPGWYEG